MGTSYLFGLLTGLGVKGCDLDIAVFLNLDKCEEGSEVLDYSIFTRIPFISCETSEVKT